MKQKLINPISMGMDERIKKDIECIIHQLENHGFAVVNNGESVREFSKKIPMFYRKNNIVLFSRTKPLKNTKVKSIIAIKPEYKLIREDFLSFRLEMKI